MVGYLCKSRFSGISVLFTINSSIFSHKILYVCMYFISSEITVRYWLDSSSSRKELA